MKTLRPILALIAIAILAAACATTAATPPPSADPSPTSPPPSATPTEAPEETPAPTEAPEAPEATAAPTQAPEETPAAGPTVAGTLTQIGAAVSGPGVSLADALAGDLSEPVFVRGALFLDTDGKVYLADSLVDAEAPTFGDLRVLVANYPTDGPTWDMANADLIGLQEANGIRFFPDTKIYGTLTR